MSSKRWLRRGLLLAAAYLPFWGLGHLRSERKGCVYVPATCVPV